MQYAVESFTGIRPTADLTIANYIGAIKPILEQEAEGSTSSVFLAELHATTTHNPHEVIKNAHELSRTLIAGGVEGAIFSQRSMQELISEAELMLRGLTSVSRLLRLPTLKEKVQHSDRVENASVALAMYPMLMASDIVVSRPAYVPTGKDQKAHLEITNELIRSFNRTFGAALPEPQAKEVELPHILSLDGSGRKMSKSVPSGAVFLDDAPEIGRKKIMKAVTASAPGEEMNRAVDNLVEIVWGLDGNSANYLNMNAVADQVKEGEPKMRVLKEIAGESVSQFLANISDRRKSVADIEIVDRLDEGNGYFRAIGSYTLEHMREAYWGS